MAFYLIFFLGFGSGTQSSAFGSKPAFGATTTTSSGLFGSGTATSGGAGFGAFGGQNQASTGFGASSTSSGGLFGQQNKNPFGTQGSTGLFGGTGSGSGGFGTGASGGGSFGASASTGFGANTQPQNQGTASTPFSAHTEKDTTTNQNVHYQSITFLQPYQNFSFEELRMADYAQGRRWGNQNGQAGAFGASTGFGGFGGTSNPGFGTNSGSGGLFGGASTSQAPFGQSQQSSSPGFGSGNATTGSSIFGQKPSTGLFGNTTTTSGQQSGSLFGTSGATGFGGGNTSGFSSGNTGGGIFGQQNQNQNKTGFGFGSGSNTGSFGTGFGQQNQQNNAGNGSTGAFGAAKPGGLFGSATTSTSLFGSNQNQQQQTQPQQQNSSPFGGFGQPQQQNQNPVQTGGLFGGLGGSTTQTQPQQQQQKPGGLFGSGTTTTGTGLFGQQNGATQQQQQQQPSSTGLFGSLGTQQSGNNSLFSNKPAAPTGGIFASTAPMVANDNSNNLFGTAQQQTQPTSLFGQNNQQQPKSLFGGSGTGVGASQGTSLFGGLGGSSGAQQNQGNSLFGPTTQQQQSGTGSLLGSSHAAPQPQQTPSLTTSLNANPYGNDQLFAGLSTPSQSVGPLATPLSSSQKQRKSSILPQYRINPSASSRLITPQKRIQGFGFSYSSYGTPGSSMSSGSPMGMNSSVLGGALGRSLGKSYSTSNLRHSFTAEDSLLAPGAFSPASRLYNSGSLKRLQIDRSLNTRPNLFGNDSVTDDNAIESGRKQVAFHQTENNDGSHNGIILRDDNSDEKGKASSSAEKKDYPAGSQERVLAHKPAQRNMRSNGTEKPEMEKTSGKELAIVPEESSPGSVSRSQNKAKEKARLNQSDQVPGEYWSQPTIDEIRDMSREQQKNISHFVAGRDNCGQIEFSRVDVTGIDLDRLLGDIIQIGIRMAAVYPQGSMQKPARGKGLNVPSVITLENSWPRARAGRDPVYERKGARYEKHLERLRRAKDTEFIDYKPETGVWRFRVQHYTTYGMDYEGEGAAAEDQDASMEDYSTVNLASKEQILSDVQPHSIEAKNHDIDSHSEFSAPESSPDDTFGYKNQAFLPGAFDEHEIPLDGVNGNFEREREDQTYLMNGNTRLSDANSLEEEGQVEGRLNRSFEEDLIDEYALSKSFTVNDEAEPDDARLEAVASKPKPSLKTSTMKYEMGEQNRVTDWAEELQRTVSPKKQNRQMLKESQPILLSQRDEHTKAPTTRASPVPQFQTSIDVMKSLFAQSNDGDYASPKKAVKRRGIEV